MPRTVLALKLAAVAVALRALVLPLTAPLRSVDRHLVWRLKEVCFGSRRPGVYPELPSQAWSVARPGLRAAATPRRGLGGPADKDQQVHCRADQLCRLVAIA